MGRSMMIKIAEFDLNEMSTELKGTLLMPSHHSLKI